MQTNSRNFLWVLVKCKVTSIRHQMLIYSILPTGEKYLSTFLFTRLLLSHQFFIWGTVFTFKKNIFILFLHSDNLSKRTFYSVQRTADATRTKKSPSLFTRGTGESDTATVTATARRTVFRARRSAKSPAPRSAELQTIRTRLVKYGGVLNKSATTFGSLRFFSRFVAREESRVIKSGRAVVR